MTWVVLEKKLRAGSILRWIERWRVRRDRCKYSPVKVSEDSFRTLYVDVSVISRHDAGSGIQRLVREVAEYLLSDPPKGWRVIAVGATHRNAYHPICWPNESINRVGQEIIVQPGDVFLGLDFALDTIRTHERQLAEFKKRGCRVWFVMYDLLPVQKPEWFSDKLVVRYQKWLRVVASLADGFYCISPPVELDLRNTLAERYCLNDGVYTHVIPMGWDLATPSQGLILAEGIDSILQQMRKSPSALIVGTLEPRKGHSDVLAAFDLLWHRNSDFNLVIVGRPGWKTEELQAKLHHHPQNGTHLFWLSNACDATLKLLYGACGGLIMASHAEGFGLPLLEALGRGKSVLARDIPIFRLNESWGLTYFPQDADSVELAKNIEKWLTIASAQLINPIQELPTWRDTTQAIWAPLIAEAK